MRTLLFPNQQMPLMVGLLIFLVSIESNIVRGETVVHSNPQTKMEVDPSTTVKEAEGVCSSQDVEGASSGANASTCTPQVDEQASNEVVMKELGLHNLESFLTTDSSSTYSIVLMYDKVDLIHDPETFQQVHETLTALAVVVNDDSATQHFPTIATHVDAEKGDQEEMKEPDAMKAKVQFGQIDIRRHAEFRRIYMGDEGELMQGFLHNIDSDTFMNTESYPPFIASRLNIFYKSNVIDAINIEDEDFMDASLPKRVQTLLEWLIQTMERTTNDDDHDILYETHPQMEQRELKEYLEEDIDHSFPFENYEKENNRNQGTETASTGDDVVEVEKDEDGETFFKYRSLYDPDEWHHDNPASQYEFGHLLHRYLTWAEAYESMWTDERKRNADRELNYGFFLSKMNEQVEQLLVHNEDILPRHDENGEVVDELDLREYFADMIFGFGRSAASLDEYMNTQIFDVYGRNMTSANDMDNIDEDGNDEVALFVRIRQLMAAFETEDDEIFQNYIATINFGLRDILADFHENISRFYVNYRNKKREAMSDGEEAAAKSFDLREPDVIDMSDPANADLLSNYDEFERRYAAQGKPVVLSNCNLFVPEEGFMAHLSDKCRHINVHHKLKLTSKVNHSSKTTNSDENFFKLPTSLMNPQRLQDEDLRYRISFEELLSLREVIDDLYLWDYLLKGQCDQLFYEKTPYDEMQKMQLPYVVGGYDLGTRVAYQDGQDNPVMFVGKKGTNTKLHLDTYNEGFFMQLVSGQKRWLIFEDAEHPFLYERLTDNSYIPDALAMDKGEKERRFFDERFPLLRHVAEQGAGYGYIQQPGEMVYVPGGLVHAVENMKDSVGISLNLVPRTAVYHYMQYAIHVQQDFTQLDMILRYLLFEQSNRDAEFAEHRDPLYTTMAEYWSQN